MLDMRLARFITVGVSAALLLFCLTWLFTRMGLSPMVGGIAAYAIAVAVAYTAQRSWTFGGRHDHASALPRYLAVQVFCALLSGVTSELAVTMLDAPPVLMSAIATVAASAASFVLSSLWVFPQRAGSA
jgi:putative flippase GtrA